jgi:hypothetical protein
MKRNVKIAARAALTLLTLGITLTVGVAACTQQAADKSQAKLTTALANVQTGINQAAKDGQLVCNLLTKDGPIAVAVVNTAAALAGQSAPALVVTGLASTVVAGACDEVAKQVAAATGSGVTGFPIAPPASLASLPAVAVSAPAAVAPGA